MICPLKFNSNTLDKDGNFAYYRNQCEGDTCRFWDSKANFNPKTKQFEGQCCILTLSRLKISGLITTHQG